MLCDEPVDTEDIVSGDHLDFFHSDYEQAFDVRYARHDQ